VIGDHALAVAVVRVLPDPAGTKYVTGAHLEQRPLEVVPDGGVRCCHFASSLVTADAPQKIFLSDMIE
jgi:hypothetical protein